MEMLENFFARYLLRLKIALFPAGYGSTQSSVTDYQKDQKLVLTLGYAQITLGFAHFFPKSMLKISLIKNINFLLAGEPCLNIHQ